ncbi:hypothetical protein ZWY2020_049023 [Hordeum vulgare]|nr:hypothetical protein ZWY2020_049023 [Hordeum vulgare]
MNAAWAPCRLCRYRFRSRRSLRPPSSVFEASPRQLSMGNSKSKAIEGDNVSDVSTGMVNSNSKATEDDKVSYVATDQGMHADDDDADQINIDVANVDEYNANGIAVHDNDDNEYSTGPGVGNSKSKATEVDIVSDVAAEDMGAFINTIVDDDTISSSFIDDEYYLFRSQVRKLASAEVETSAGTSMFGKKHFFDLRFHSQARALRHSWTEQGPRTTALIDNAIVESFPKYDVFNSTIYLLPFTCVDSNYALLVDSIQLRKQLMIQMLTIKHNEAAGNIPAEIREALRVITD